MATHTLTFTYQGSGFAFERSVSKTGTGVVAIDGETVADSTTDGEIALTLDVSEVEAFFLVSDQNITLETNAIDATGGNTIALLAGEPYTWFSTDKAAFLLTEDVTTTYWTNASGAAATVYCVALYDATP